MSAPECSCWTAEEISIEDFLEQAKAEEITAFALTVHPDEGKRDIFVHMLSFYLDAVGYRQGEEVIAREGAFLRAVAFTDQTCRKAVPLISASPWRPLFQEIAMQIGDYTALWETTLHMALPWREVQTFELKHQETMESIYAKLGMREEGRKAQVDKEMFIYMLILTPLWQN